MTKTIPCPGCGGGGCTICQICKGKGTIETYSVDGALPITSYDAQLKLFKFCSKDGGGVISELLQTLNDIVRKEKLKRKKI